MKKNIRVRFAPSPTGPLHIGGVRTALYNYLFAKKHGGDFILRIEDTDQNRYVEGAEAYIKEALQWCKLSPDEGPDQGGAFGPYRQSERKEIYQQHVDLLLQQGKAYLAFDTVEELEAMRAKGDGHAKYDGSTRDKMRNSISLSPSDVKGLIDSGTPHVVRLLVPCDRSIVFRDEVRGEVTFESKELDDKVILKADGLPTYHLANVVDDYHMKISHVIRGEEWLSSTAHHVLLYEAFGWEGSMPVFAHLPLILKPTGKGKLSKRDGQKFGFPVFPLAWNGADDNDSFAGFRSVGFDPDAMINFLAFLGWNPGTEQEIFSLDALVAAFSLEHIGKSGARFDFDKALWYNSQYISHSEASVLADAVRPFMADDVDDDTLLSLVKLLKDRLNTYAEMPEKAAFYFSQPEEYNEKIVRKKWTTETNKTFVRIGAELEVLTDSNASTIKQMVSDIINGSGLKFGDILPLLRVAITGDTKGPDLFEMMHLLGPEETARRMQRGATAFDRQLGM